MNLKVKFFVTMIALSIISTIIYLNFEPLSFDKEFNFPKRFLLKSKCECITDVVIVNKFKDDYHITVERNDSTTILEYEIKIENFKKLILACDLFKVLRRGPNQKIIGFSLFGKEQLYYDLLEANIRNAKTLYPNWTIRVYHDDSIDNSIICKQQCLSNDQDELLNNIDFCNVNKIIENNKIKSYNYMLPMTWRWLPIGDDFTSLFISRDSDSCIFDREIAAVNQWLTSKSLFHIMRDAPAHGPKILGGMWGFYNSRNKHLAKYFYNIITSKLITYWYKFYLILNKRGADQYILAWYFWPIAKQNSTIHDSYHCQISELGGKHSQPFPTQRPNFPSCHVGALGCCNSDPGNKNSYVKICPVECRPKMHKDWIYC